MKLGTLSLVAVMALGTSAYAIENVKVTGDIKVIYQTSDVELTAGEKAAGAETGLFKQGNGVVGVSPYNAGSAGGIGGTLGATADLAESVSAGVQVQMYTTLGLENNVFGDNMINAPYGETGFTNAFEERTKDAMNISELWLAKSLGKTTLKAGRMELDTPLVFTEKWNVAKNTFESLVAINTDLPDTTLVGAWVGRHNGHGSFDNRTDANSGDNINTRLEGGIRLAGSPGRTVNMDSFRSFGAHDTANGAYAFGAVNKSIADTTLQAWYYDVVSIADAFWLQADTKVAGMVSLGAQYAALNPKGTAETVGDSKIYAVKAAVDVVGVNLYAAYSSADKDGYMGFSNISTADKTNIYTGQGSIYFDGVVTAPGVDAYKIGAKGAVAGINLAAAYVNADGKDSPLINGGVDGFDFSASTKVGDLGLTAMYTIVNNDSDKTISPPAGNPFYLGRDIDTLRMIASYKF